MFLDFSVKMQSPPFLVPATADYDKKALTLSFEKIEKDILELVDTHNLSLVCMDFELPGFGPFTKYEWVGFSLIHTQRHTRQLKNIFSELDK